MPTVAPSGGGNNPAVAKNRGGTAIGIGGKGADSQFTKALDVFQLADDVGSDIGSLVKAKTGTGGPTTDRVGVTKAVSAGTLAFTQTSTTWLMQGINASTIGGVNNNMLVSPNSDWDGTNYDNIHQLTANRTYGSGNSAIFNFYARSSGVISPNFTKGANAGGILQYVRPSGNGTIAATDDAASPTRSVPGELTYMFGGTIPKNDVYKAKDSYET